MEATIEIVYHANSVQMRFMDVANARAAYDKIKAALAEYQRWKNDRRETVEVDSEQGGKTTLKLERIDAVLFNEPQPFNEDRFRKHFEEEKRLRDLREQLGLPPMPERAR